MEVNSDGRKYTVPAGTLVELKNGQSITLWPHQYHEFHVVPGSGIRLYIKKYFEKYM